MVLDEGVGANSTLFFTGEQNERDGAFRFPTQCLERPRRLQRRHCACTVVQSALTQVPGIEMAADNHPLLGTFRTLDFRDGNGDWRRLVAERVLQLRLQSHRSNLQQPPYEVVLLVGQESD